MITKGRYRLMFWWGAVVLGNITPFALLLFEWNSILLSAAGLAVLIGIYFTEHIWVEAPQRIALS